VASKRRETSGRGDDQAKNNLIGRKKKRERCSTGGLTFNITNELLRGLWGEHPNAKHGGSNG